MSDVARAQAAEATTDATAQLRLRKVAAAVRAWTGQLIDLGGRNTLLYYKDLKQGTLDLGPYSGAEPVALDALLGSRTVRLAEMFNREALARAARRARTIRAKAMENFEERGLRTLYLAWMMATWENPRGTATPAAPVFLRLANLSPRGGAGEEWRGRSVDGGAPRLPSHLATVEGAYAQFATELRALSEWVGWPLGGLAPEALSTQLSSLIADKTTLYRLPELHRLKTGLAARGLSAVVAEMASRNLTVDQTLGCLEYVWLSSILESVSMADRRVGTFDGATLRRTVNGFRLADTQHIETAPVRISRAVAEQVTRVRDAFPRESDVVEHQARLKRKHMPVRDLFQAAPHVLASLKPCWAMSPLVVSQLLPPERHFEV